jgi:uncharacterized protein
MMRPEFYPHPCDRVELRQTMMSWLLFAGRFVYKIKKPLRSSIVDAGTPAKRYRLCQEEVLFNRRLAPAVYLGVSAVARSQRSYMLVVDPAAVKGGPPEFAVVMRRLPSEQMLERMLARNSVKVNDVEELARKLASFHTSASIAKSKVWGSAQAISRLVTGNLAEAQVNTADSVTRDQLAVAATYTRRFLISHNQTLDNRARDGHVLEGHGNLRCKSVCFAPDGPAILDCAASNEGLRYGDVASELASLAVDFDLLERSDLADALFKTYVAETNDQQLFDVLGFYKCYRAILRGKFETLVSLQADLPTEQRIAARTQARQLFALAGNYAGARDANLVL